LIHKTSSSFWYCYERLPLEIQQLADKKFLLLKSDPNHPSLQFKKVGKVWSVRVGLHYRAVATQIDGGYLWFWIVFIQTMRNYFLKHIDNILPNMNTKLKKVIFALEKLMGRKKVAALKNYKGKINLDIDLDLLGNRKTDFDSPTDKPNHDVTFLP
jgi:hypothetical protein